MYNEHIFFDLRGLGSVASQKGLKNSFKCNEITYCLITTALAQKKLRNALRMIDFYFSVSNN